MIKLIVGAKGSGKTKALVDMINTATQTTSGSVVVIEKGMQLTYNISPKARLVDLDEYKVTNYDMACGFVAGMLASNYDITELFVDGLTRVGTGNLEELGAALDKINSISGETTIVATVSAAPEALPESIKKYL